jgi:hypothetical protein
MFSGVVPRAAKFALRSFGRSRIESSDRPQSLFKRDSHQGMTSQFAGKVVPKIKLRPQRLKPQCCCCFTARLKPSPFKAKDFSEFLSRLF